MALQQDVLVGKRTAVARSTKRPGFSSLKELAVEPDGPLVAPSGSKVGSDPILTSPAAIFSTSGVSISSEHSRDCAALGGAAFAVFTSA
jgi:hypothetical protein